MMHRDSNGAIVYKPHKFKVDDIVRKAIGTYGNFRPSKPLFRIRELGYNGLRDFPHYQISDSRGYWIGHWWDEHMLYEVSNAEILQRKNAVQKKSW